MKDLYKWTSGTKYVFYNKSNAATAGKTDYSATVDMLLNYINTTPNDGKNQGNLVSPTNWEYSVEVYRKFIGMRQQFYPVGTLYETTVGVYGGDPLAGPTWERNSLYNDALSKLNSKVRDRADWAEDVAQAKATAKSAKLGALAGDLVEAARNLKRDPLSLIGATAASYLQYRYAWSPLINNIFDTASAALNINDGGSIRLTSTAMRKMSDSGTCANAGSGTSSPVVRFNNTGKQGCRFVVDMRGMDENRLADFTTLDPRVLAWNLLPWSFVVDWVYGIGGYLEAQEHALRYNPLFLRGYVTELYANFRTEEITDAVVSTSFTVKQGRAMRREIRFKRTALASWPLPRRPVLNTDLGSSKLLAAAALLGTILRR